MVDLVDARVEKRGFNAAIGGIERARKRMDAGGRSEFHQSIAFFDGGRQARLLEEFGEAGALDFGKEDRAVALWKGRDDNLAAEIFAGCAKLLNHGCGAAAVRLHPLLELRALGGLLLEDAFGFAEIIRQVRNTG